MTQSFDTNTRDEFGNTQYDEQNKDYTHFCPDCGTELKKRLIANGLDDFDEQDFCISCGYTLDA